jgi:SAM-dependent methyltransferase
MTIKNHTIEVQTRKLFHGIHLRHLKNQKSLIRLQKLIDTKRFGVKNNFFENKICLDAGCGSSYHGSINLINLGAKKVIGMDLDTTILKNLKNLKKILNKNISKLDIKIGSVLKMPFKKEFFDFVLCQGVIHHTTNPKLGFKECYRVLKKGGHAYFQINGKGGLVNEFVMTYLRDYYLKNKEFKTFVDTANQNKIKKYLLYMKKNLVIKNMHSNSLLDSLTKLIDEDLILSLKDRICSPIYEKYSYQDLEEELKKIGFKKIKRIFTNVKYENLRNIFTHFYRNPNLKESKFLYGSGLINVLVQK